MTIVREDATTKVRQSQLRAVLGGVALGLSMTVLLTGLLDRMLTCPKGKMGRRHASVPEGEPQEEASRAAEDQARVSRRGTKRSRRPAAGNHRRKETAPKRRSVPRTNSPPWLRINSRGFSGNAPGSDGGETRPVQPARRRYCRHLVRHPPLHGAD